MKNLRKILPLLPVFALVSLVGCNEPEKPKTFKHEASSSGFRSTTVSRAAGDGFSARTGHSGFATRR
ncbi:hypothetical protein D3C80_1095800 [compost metagenome]